MDDAASAGIRIVIRRDTPFLPTGKVPLRPIYGSLLFPAPPVDPRNHLGGEKFFTMAIRSSLLRRARLGIAVAARRPIAVCFAAAGTLLVGTGIIVAAPGGASADVAAAAAYQPDVASLLDTRSPGGRRYGWLVNTKHDRYADDPVERVLSSVRRRSAAAVDGSPLVGDPVMGAVLIPDATGLYDAPPVNDGAAAIGPVGGSPIGGVIGGGLVGGGGTGGGDNGGGGGVTDPNPTPTPVTPVTPVPEAATWAMMLLGFALLGLAVRRRGSALALSR